VDRTANVELRFGLYKCPEGDIVPFLTVWSVQQEVQGAEVLFEYEKQQVEASKQYWDISISNVIDANRLVSNRRQQEVGTGIQ
jgi:hypothetical protein